MQTAPSRDRSNDRYLILLIAAFTLVFMAGFTCLRIVRDDWSSLSNFEQGMQGKFSVAMGRLITNEWLGLRQARIYFMSWLIQLAIGFLGRFNYVPYYLFILALHCGVSILLFRILKRILGGAAPAALLACLYLVLPANTNVLFWLNNWFFTLPFFFLIAQIHLQLFPLRNAWLQLAVLTLLTLLGQFSGEQPLVMLYLSLGLFFVHAACFKHGAERARGMIIPASAAVLCGSALVYYIARVMVFSVTDNTIHFSWELVFEYLRGFYKQFISTFDPSSWYYGSASVPASLTSTRLMVGLIVVLVGFFLRETNAADWKVSWKRFALLASLLALFAIASLLPCLYGACSGDRPGAATRYLFVPAFAIVGAVYAVLMLVLVPFPARFRKYAAMPLVLGVGYCGSLTIYSLHNVWGFQKVVDQRIWDAIDAKVEARHSSIITNNLSAAQGQLMAHYHSDAVSDFQADWGVGSRMWAKYRRPFAIGQSVEEIPGSENLRARTYYSEYFEIPRDKVLFVTFRYGPLLEDLSSGEIQIFTTYADYQHFKQQLQPNPQ